jgi:hypothetical protein
MSKMKVILVLFACFFTLAIAGCGGKNVNGTLSVTGETEDTVDGTMTMVTFTVQYTNPTESNLINVPITYWVYDGDDLEYTETVYTNNTGGFLVSPGPYTRTGVNQTVRLVAKTGDLVYGASVIVPAFEEEAAP